MRWKVEGSPDKNDLILRSNRDEIVQDFKGSGFKVWSVGVLEYC